MEIVQVLEERGSNYGAFSGHSAATQALKVVVHNHLSTNTNFASLSPSDQSVVVEALDMIMHKVGRIVNGQPLFEDSWVDIAGYASLVPRNTGGKSL